MSNPEETPDETPETPEKPEKFWQDILSVIEDAEKNDPDAAPVTAMTPQAVAIVQSLNNIAKHADHINQLLLICKFANIEGHPPYGVIMIGSSPTSMYGLAELLKKNAELALYGQMH